MNKTETKTILRILQTGFLFDKSLIYDTLTAGYGFPGEANEVPFEVYPSMAIGVPGQRPAVLDNQQLLDVLLIRCENTAPSTVTDCPEQRLPAEEFGLLMGHAIESLAKSEAAADRSRGGFGYCLSLEESIAVAMGIISTGAEKLGWTEKNNSETIKVILNYFGFPVKVDLKAEEIADAAFALLPDTSDSSIRRFDCNADIIYPEMPGRAAVKSVTKEELLTLIDAGFERGNGPLL